MIYPKRLQSYRTIPSLWWTTLVSLFSLKSGPKGKGREGANKKVCLLSKKRVGVWLSEKPERG